MAKAYWVVAIVQSPTTQHARNTPSSLFLLSSLLAAASSLAVLPPRRMSTASKSGLLWLSLRASTKQSLRTILRSTKRHSPFWGMGPSATCGSSKASTIERMRVPPPIR
jgi:hypothetical protein